MKIAFPTNDGVTISPSFGQAQYYVFITVDENGTETARKELSKAHHGGDHHHHHKHKHGQGHGGHNGPPKGIFAPLKECQTVIAGGIGEPGFRAVTSMGLEFILTPEHNINVALDAYLNNTLQHVPALVHRH